MNACGVTLFLRNLNRTATLAADFRSRTKTMQQLEFELDRDFVELNQLLKLTGLCDSGGAGKQLVASGAVRVDGVVELRKTCKIHPGQVVTLDDVEIRVVAPG
jgi:ribosome-associated protein